MSDSYHYEDGAKHYDHKKVLHIDKVQGADLQQLMRAFFKDDAEEAEVWKKSRQRMMLTKRNRILCRNKRMYTFMVTSHHFLILVKLF